MMWSCPRCGQPASVPKYGVWCWPCHVALELAAFRARQILARIERAKERGSALAAAAQRGAGPAVRVLSLFSGVGGLELGLEWAGFQTVGQCEIDPACRF